MRIRLACKFTFFRSHASPFPRFFVTSSLLLPPRCPPFPSLRSLTAQCVPGSVRGKSALRFALRQVPPPQSTWTARRLRLLLIDADVYGGTASWGGEVLFRFAPLSSFPLILYLLGVVRSPCVPLHKRGIGALCAEFRRCIGLPSPPRKMPAWVANGGLRDGKKRGGKCAETGRFLHRLPPVRLRERSPPRVVEPCRRRAREEVERHGRERDECRAKT